MARYADSGENRSLWQILRIERREEASVPNPKFFTTFQVAFTTLDTTEPYREAWANWRLS